MVWVRMGITCRRGDWHLARGALSSWQLKLDKDAGRELFAYIMRTMKCSMIERRSGEMF